MAKESKENKGKRREESVEPSRSDAELFAVDAERFKALGDPIRLAVVGFLVSWESTRPVEAEEGSEASDDGATVSEIAASLTVKNGKEPSTLSHHLKELRHAGLITMTRHGKNLHYRAEMATIVALCERLNCRGVEPEEASTSQVSEEEGEEEVQE